MAIHLHNIGKAYPFFSNRREALAVWLGLKKRQQNWILRHVNFDVKQGESIGLIGVNGAGKSTLLKMITGTSIPSEGSIEIEGQVSALLELGMGFHPELTGRQNAFLASRMQGLDKQQIIDLIPEIAEFAEIGSYFDQPVRTYSSGMFVRLAFSVATAVRPDILIVDEALSVGDAYFQHKSFSRIRQFREGGSTLLFVSHDAGAIKSICDRAILLGQGGVILDGKPDDVLDYYNALISERSNHAAAVEKAKKFQGRSGNQKAKLLECSVESQGKSGKIVEVGAPITIAIRFNVTEKLPDLALGFMIKNRLGEDVFGSNTELRHELSDIGETTGEHLVHIDIAALNLGPGHYSLTLALHSGRNHLEDNYDWWDRAVMIEVIANLNAKVFAGACALDATITEMPVLPQTGDC